MDCRAFREKHIAFVDDTLPIIDMEAMERHRGLCPRCARHDTAVRRSLLIARNLPEIQPSPDFMARLNARIHDLERASPTPGVRPLRSAISAFSAIAAVLALAAYMALDAVGRLAPSEPLRLAPVVASVPDLPEAPALVAGRSLMVAIPTGMPVWSAVLDAGQVPMHLANVELQSER